MTALATVSSGSRQDSYAEFLARKAVVAAPCGFEPCVAMPEAIKPFQRDIVTWACRRGRAAIFAGTGLGKTIEELTWARQVVAHTQGRVLIFAPLAVAEQIVQVEALKFGFTEAAYAADESEIRTPIVVTNYERRDKFDLSQFAGVALDESGILKDHDSRTRADLTEACASVPYLLCASATPAPNDWTELGQHSEFLGVMSAKEMLSMFFVHDGSVRAKGEEDWRLKRHAEQDFWRWVASWAVMIRHPRDLGYDESGYDLPPLHLRQVTVSVDYKPTSGWLFPMQASTLGERIAARRDSIEERVKAAAKLIRGDWACQQELPTRTKNTCAPITPKTERVGTSELPSSGRDISPTDGSATRQIPLCAPELQSRISDMPRAEENGRIVSSENSASRKNNMTASSPGREEDAQSAAGIPPISVDISSTLTTITKQELCEESSALPATLVLANSKTTSTGSIEQSNTCLKRGKESWLIWCQLNNEQRALEREFGDDCVSVYGSQTTDEKIRLMFAWLRGDVPILISKPSIFGRGLNFQHCNRMVFVGLNDSFEQLFQAIRRCWRFGQTREVNAYLIASELEGAVVANLRKKEQKYEAMAEAMAGHMKGLCSTAIRGGRHQVSVYAPEKDMEVPTWLAA